MPTKTTCQSQMCTNFQLEIQSDMTTMYINLNKYKNYNNVFTDDEEITIKEDQYLEQLALSENFKG